MKSIMKFAIFFVILLGITVALSIYNRPNCKDMENYNTPAYSCSSDSDCFLYIDNCCPVMSSAAINKEYQSCIPKNKNVNLFGEPCGYSCEMSHEGWTVPTEVQCVNNKCVVKR